MGLLERVFHLEERGTTVGIEIRAGIASFLTMSYGLLVNPQIMAHAGIPKRDGVMATAGASAFASIAVGLLGNLPFGMSPGVGLSAYLAYGLVASGVLTSQQALTSVFIAGVIVIIMTVSGIANYLMKLTPHHIKLAIVVGMGLLIALIGLVSIELVVASGDDSLIAMGDLGDWQIWLVLGGLGLIGTLIMHGVEGSILISIVLLSFVYWAISGEWPQEFFQMPYLESSFSDKISIDVLNVDCVGPILACVFVILFDVSGVMFGLSSLAGLTQADGHVPGGIWCFLCCSAGTLVAAALGTSPIIAAVENAAGVKEGGRTGLTAVTVGVFYLLSLFLYPIFGDVPTCATAPVLVLVGSMMMKEATGIDWASVKQAIPAFLCIAMMPFTYSIPNGILFGMAGSLVFYFTSGDAWMQVKSKWDGVPPSPVPVTGYGSVSVRNSIS